MNCRKTIDRAVAIVAAAALVLSADPALADQVRGKQWHLRALNLAEANKITKGQGILVAVLDTGVSSHIDLSGNVLSGTSVISVGKANGQGDPNGHGTAMASLIAAHGRGKDVGVLGVAPSAKIIPVRMADAETRTNSIDAAKAIEWAANHGARIINFSVAVAPSIALQSAMEVARRKDVLVVAAAGNRSQDVVAAYPAAMPGALAVGASDRAGKPAGFSVSAKYVQVCAPGVDIEAADRNNGYSNGRGTSQATAIASGAAALVRARFPSLSAQEVIHRLTATATDNGPAGRDDKCGYGVLNIVKALTADVPPLGVSSSAAAPPTAAASVSAAAASRSEEPSGSAPAIIGGLVAALLVGGLAAFLVVRRRRSSTPR